MSGTDGEEEYTLMPKYIRSGLSRIPMRTTSSSKLPARFAPIAFALYMSGLVAFMMSLALTAINTGLDSAFLGRALRGYLVAWPVGFVSVMLVRPLVLRLVQMTVATAPQR